MGDRSSLNIGERWRLRFTKVVLLMILLGILLIGRRRKAWPIVNWSMYSHKVMTYPEDTTDALHLEIIVDAGRRVRLDMHDFFPPGMSNVAEVIVERSFAVDSVIDQAEYRDALQAMVGRALPGQRVSAIEAWRFTWDVNPLALPPLRRSQPAERRLVGRLHRNSTPDEETDDGARH